MSVPGREQGGDGSTSLPREQAGTKVLLRLICIHRCVEIGLRGAWDGTVRVGASRIRKGVASERKRW